MTLPRVLLEPEGPREHVRNAEATLVAEIQLRELIPGMEDARPLERALELVRRARWELEAGSPRPLDQLETMLRAAVALDGYGEATGAVLDAVLERIRRARVELAR